MVEPGKPAFDAESFLANAGLGRKIVQLEPKQAFFSQGDPADSVFYLQKGRAKVTVVSQAGKEATITLLSAGDFVGESALAAVPGATIILGDRHYCLHRTQDHARRNDPRDP